MNQLTLAELLLRDPQHPEVKALLLERYQQVCNERAMLARLLGLSELTRRERDQAGYEQRTQAPS